MLSKEKISSWWWLIVVDDFRCYRIIETWIVKTETINRELTRRLSKTRSDNRFPILQMFKCKELFHLNEKSYFIQMWKIISFKREKLFHLNAKSYFI
jgi:hypothetical protein